MTKCDWPRKIICLTEESVETLYLLGQESRIMGVSVYAKRPTAVETKPKVSAFTHAQLNKIIAMKPDLVLGFSDIQKDIARELVGAGIDVWMANHRSLAGVLDYVLALGRLVGEREKAKLLVESWQRRMEEIQALASHFKTRPKVYFEEWDEPMISAIQWVSELIEICGGKNIFADLAQGILAKDRMVTIQDVQERNPDIILGCWCGKKVRLDSFRERFGSQVSAIAQQQIAEVSPEVFLQPGPALFESGLAQLSDTFLQWSRRP